MQPADFLAVAGVYPDPMLLVAGDGRIAAASDAAARALDREEGALVSQSLGALVTDAADEVASYLRICARSRQAVMGSLTFRLPAGSRSFGVRGARLWRAGEEAELLVVLRLSAKTDHVKSFLGLNERVDALNREIIRRQAAERELRVSEQWLKITLLSIGDAVIATDDRGRVKFMNAVAEALTGWSGAQADGRRLREIFHIVDESTGAPVESPVDVVRQRGCVVGRAHHTVLVTRDGRRVPIADSGAPIRDPSGHMTGVVLVFRDVSGERDMERERHALLMEAEQARAAAEMANRAKDEFLAILSHELRTPLNAILGWTQLLQTGRISEPQRARALQVIERNAKAQAQLIEDVLDVSRIVSGKLELELKEVSLAAVVLGAVESAQPSADAKGIRLTVEPHPDLAPVRGDVERLQQVIGNLISNAIKFSAAGTEVRLSIRADGADAGDGDGVGVAEVVVRDSGEGIEPEALPYIFERFRQEDSSSRRRHGGLGLGLAIVKHLVEAHRGTVTAHSAGKGKGMGATFRIRLPLAGAAGVASPAPSLRGDPDFEVALHGIHVLVVDDEPDARELAAATLKERGATVAGAASVAEALAELARARPDVLVSDIGLPRHDGFDLIRQLRSLPEAAGGAIPALALTAFASPTDRSRILWEGFQMYLAKPADSHEIVLAVASLAGRTRHRR